MKRIFGLVGLVLLAVFGATILWCIVASGIGAGLDFMFDLGIGSRGLLGLGSVVLVFTLVFTAIVMVGAGITIAVWGKNRIKGIKGGQ